MLSLASVALFSQLTLQQPQGEKPNNLMAAHSRKSNLLLTLLQDVCIIANKSRTVNLSFI